MLQRRGRNMERRRVDFTGVRKDVLRNNRGKAAIGELRIRDLCGAPPVARKLDAVDVCDIATVERTNIAWIGAVVRPIDLARRERKPADLRPDRPGDVQPDPRAAEKADERPCIDRRPLGPTGDPAPASADERPSPVMRRRKSPGLVINPGPAPSLNPDPTTLRVP